MISEDWIKVEDQLPPISDSSNENILMWTKVDWRQAVVGWFDGDKFWFVDDYEHECEPSHWQLIVAP